MRILSLALVAVLPQDPAQNAQTLHRTLTAHREKAGDIEVRGRLYGQKEYCPAGQE